MNKRLRTILLITLMILLLGSAVFLGYQIYTTNQAPEDTSASVWCASEGKGPGQCPTGDRVDFGGPACVVWKLRDNDACKSSGLQECYASNECGAQPGGCNPTTTGYCLNYTSPTGGATSCSPESFRVEIHIEDANGRRSDAECVGTTVPLAARQVRNVSPGGSVCANTVTAECGKCVQIDFEGLPDSQTGGAAYYTGDCTDTPPPPPPPPATPTTCYRCTERTDDGNNCESFTINGSTCPTGSSSSPTGCAVAVGGQCPVDDTPPPPPPPGNVTCYRCTPSETDGDDCESEIRTVTQGCRTGWTTNSSCAEETNDGQCPTIFCGDAKCQTGEICESAGGGTFRLCTANNGLAPTGPIVDNCQTTGAQACQQTPDTRELVITKSSVGVCLANGSQDVTYTVLIRNTGSGTVSHDEVIDTINAPILASSVSSISPSAVSVQNANSYSLTWGAGTIAAGASNTYTYKVNYTAQQSADLGYQASNFVVVTYDDSGTPVEMSYSHRVVLELCGGPLPATNLDDNSMFILAGLLFVIAAIVYRQGYGASRIEKLIVNVGSITRGRRTRFEKDVLDDI